MGNAISSNTAADFDPIQVVREDRVHRSVYADPHIFDLEMHRIFGRTWVYVGHESEVEHSGDYKLSWVGKQPVVVSRDDDGRIHVLYNRCRHRAATVCQDRSGNSQFFRCIYHGWTYSNNGQLVGVPWREGYGDDFDPTEWGLVHVARVESYRGFIFARLTAEGPSLSDHLGHAKPYIDAFADISPTGRLHLAAGHNVVVDANWKLQIENGVDSYHAAYLHQTYFKIRERRRQFGVSTGEATASFAVALGNGHTLQDRRGEVGDKWARFLERQPAGRAYLAEYEARLGAEKARRMLGEAADCGFNLAVYPNLLFFGVTVRTLRPVGVDRTEVSLQPALLADVPEELNAFRLRFHEEFYSPSGFAAPDDWEALTRVQDGLRAEDVGWLILSRGLGRERVEGELVYSNSTDETPQRAQFAWWVELMRRAEVGPSHRSEAGERV